MNVYLEVLFTAAVYLLYIYILTCQRTSSMQYDCDELFYTVDYFEVFEFGVVDRLANGLYPVWTKANQRIIPV